MWILATTQARREMFAAENICRLGFDVYLPKIGDIKYVSALDHKKVIRVKPLFPRYLFVNTPDRWKFLLGTWGVTGVVLRGESPDMVPDKVIDQMRQREDPEGLISLPKLYDGHRFKVGQKVTIRDGSSVSGLQGVYQGMSPHQRVRVLLEFMGRKTTFLIAEHAIEPS
jgi:transcriptional antiterminator RfaH